MSEEVVVTMTSWKKRIGGVSKAIFSLLRNTHKPRSIELNLSTDEFPQKEEELPDDLVLLQKNGLVNINWVKRNTKSFKKVLPTVRKYFNEKELLIMSADDDVIYPQNIIERFLISYRKHPDAFITFGNVRGRFKTQPCVNGGATLYKVSFFNESFFKIPESIINTNEDDWWYSYCFWKNGGRNAVFTGVKLDFFNQETKHNYNTAKTKNLLMKMKIK